MPSTDTSDLAETFVRLARQFLGVPTGSDALETFALSDTDDINHLILGENALDGNFLFKMFTGKVNFVSDGSAI